MVDQSRLENLNIDHQDVTVGRGYSWFVKSMRLILPVAAIGLIFAVVAWPKMEEELVIVPKEELVQKPQNEIGENELLNPHFETMDSNHHPVNVTAARALHNQDDPNSIRLEKPNANLQMENGDPVNIQALNGTYEQETQKLFLENDVAIKHGDGYELRAQELRVDMKTREAFSDKNITINGPTINIEATGLNGNMDNGTLIFNGPAKLTLNMQDTTPLNNNEQSDGI